MRLTFLLIILVPIQIFGQTYLQFVTFNTTELVKHKSEIPLVYYQVLQNIINRRDTAYLKNRFEETNAKQAWIVEGLNFETGEYGIFEEYRTDTNWFARSKMFMNEIVYSETIGFFFIGKLQTLSTSIAVVDTIYPRKYKYGAGDYITSTTNANIAEMDSLAKKDGIVIEKYCRIETFIDNISHKISTRFSFPVQGQRLSEIDVGMFTDWPKGLSFWLFNVPATYFASKK